MAFSVGESVDLVKGKPGEHWHGTIVKVENLRVDVLWQKSDSVRAYDHTTDSRPKYLRGWTTSEPNANVQECNDASPGALHPKTNQWGAAFGVA